MYEIDKNISNNIGGLLDKNIQFIKSNKKIEFANVPCVIDIETSSFYENGEKRGVMYAFIIGINGKRIIGRTYEELNQWLDEISFFYKLGKNRRMIFYIHNLSYDFQFIRKWRNWISVFSTDKREPLYALDEKGIELRCSYQLSGYSLENVGENLSKYNSEKKVGDLDYSLIRHSETPLTEKEIGYIDHDGIIVMNYIQEEIENHHNNISLLPLTKTGKVRSYVRKQCLYGGKHHRNSWKFQKYHNMMKAIPIVSLNEYNQLKRAFHGGFTHANGYYVGKITNDVVSFDFTSSYPYVLISEMFPMGAGELVTIKSTEEFERNMKLYCCLFDVTFEDIYATAQYEHPISVSKCWSIHNYASDNGRLVNADEISITLTEQDFIIIRKFYSWKKMKIKNFRRYHKNYLPHDFVKSVLDLYQTKTKLKDVEEHIAEYMNSKEMLNSCYGMTVTDICRDEIEYDGSEWIMKPNDPEEELKKYNEKKNRFIAYQWGVWVTAYAMRNLFTAIYELKTDYLYADTDSVKFINYEKHKRYFEKYNCLVKEKLKRAMYQHGFDIELTRPKTIDGKTKIIGVWDYETTYKRFVTLGAKRYMVQLYEPKKYQYGENIRYIDYSLTVSGVNKRFAIPYLYDKYGELMMEEFKDGLYIPPKHTGKQIHTYIDEETFGTITDYFGKSLNYHEKASIHMEPSAYELSLSKEFIDYLMGIELICG